MRKIHRAQVCTIKDMMYPEINNKTDNTFHKKNLQNIKKQQEDNKNKVIEKENNKQTEVYKMKEFQNVASKVSTVNPIKLQDKNDPNYKKSSSVSMLKRPNKITSNNVDPNKYVNESIDKQQYDNAYLPNINLNNPNTNIPKYDYNNLNSNLNPNINVNKSNDSLKNNYDYEQPQPQINDHENIYNIGGSNLNNNNNNSDAIIMGRNDYVVSHVVKSEEEAKNNSIKP